MPRREATLAAAWWLGVVAGTGGSRPGLSWLGAVAAVAAVASLPAAVLVGLAVPLPFASLAVATRRARRCLERLSGRRPLRVPRSPAWRAVSRRSRRAP